MSQTERLRAPTPGKPPQRAVYSTPLAQRLKPVSLGDIAEKAGISYGYMAKIARGAKACPPRVRIALQELLDEPWWYLLGFERDPDPGWDGTFDGPWSWPES